MRMKKISQTFKIILSVLSHYCSQNTFTFSNVLVNVQSSKTDTFSVVLSLQTHLLALADQLLDFLRPQLARKIYQVQNLHLFVICFLSSLITSFQIHLMGIIQLILVWIFAGCKVPSSLVLCSRGELCRLLSKEGVHGPQKKKLLGQNI